MPAATTRPAYLMPVGHPHTNGPNTRVKVHNYVPHLHTSTYTSTLEILIPTPKTTTHPHT